MENTGNKATGKIVTALIIGLVVGFGAGAFWQERRLNNVLPEDQAAALSIGGKTSADKQTSAAVKNSAKDTSTASASTTVKTNAPANDASVDVKGKAGVGITGGEPVGTDSLKISDQPAGSSVKVDSVSADSAVWVAVREEVNGALGNILGAQKVAAGESSDVTIDLLRPTKAGSKYVAVLYKDMGSPAFNYREDVLVAGVQGEFAAQ